MTPGERDEVVRAHNSFRQKLASGGEQGAFGFPAASNMMKIVWDEELAFIAQAHADQCKYVHDCTKCRKVDEYTVGQNMYKSRSNGPSDYIEADWTLVTNFWYNGIAVAPLALVDRYQSSPNPRAFYRYFTQMVWADTWKIGCGFTASTTDGGVVEKLYTCNYGPSGNWVTKPTYKKGSPASQCPDNTAQAQDNPALCEALDFTGPKGNEKKLRETSLFYCDFSDGTVCGLNIQHDNNAFLVPNNLFQYLSFKVSASQRVSIELPNPIQSADPWCLTYETRQGADDAKDQANNEFLEVIRQGDVTNQGILYSESVEWYQHITQQEGDPNPAYVKLTFKVPAGASQQVLEIKSIVVTPGKCQYS